LEEFENDPKRSKTLCIRFNSGLRLWLEGQKSERKEIKKE